MESTTPIEEITSNVNYTFYFEVNQSNYLYICNFNKYFTQFQGYNWDNIFNTNSNCNNCPNQRVNNYPITDMTDKSQSIPIGEGGLTFQKNTFLVTDEIELTDTVSMSCSSYISTTGCVPFTSSNLCVKKETTNEEITTPLLFDEEITTPSFFDEERTTPSSPNNIKILDGENKTVYSQSVSCFGEDCLKFFPPSTITFQNSFLYNPNENINNIVDCNSDNLNYSAGFPACFDNNGNPTQICYNGNPIVKYNLYKPLNYSKLPSVNSSNQYIAPSTPMNAGFYNVYPFTTELELVQSYTDNGSNIPKGSYAIYKVFYSFNPTQFKNQENQLKDFTNLQKYLDSTYSSWFKTTSLYQITNENINQIISDYCYYTSDNTSSLCQIETFIYKPSFINKYQYLIGVIIFIVVLLIFFKK